MASNCTGDPAYKKYATDRAKIARENARVDVAIQTALALWKRNASSSISAMQASLAKRQYKLAEKVREHLRKFWPYETAFVNDAFGEPRAVAQYSATSTSWGAITDDSLSRGRSAFLSDIKLKCISVSDCEDVKWKRGMQQIRADMISYADRQAEGRKEALNDKRYAKQYAALELGRNYLGQIPSFQNLSGSAGANLPQLGNIIARGAEMWGVYRWDNYGNIDQFKDDYSYLPDPYKTNPNEAQSIRQTDVLESNQSNLRFDFNTSRMGFRG